MATALKPAPFFARCYVWRRCETDLLEGAGGRRYALLIRARMNAHRDPVSRHAARCSP